MTHEWTYCALYVLYIVCCTPEFQFENDVLIKTTVGFLGFMLTDIFIFMLFCPPKKNVSFELLMNKKISNLK